MPINVNWVKCGNDGHWCSLQTLLLKNLGDVEGVYIIWHDGKPGRVVRVGQGIIKDRLAEHCNDTEVCGHNVYGTLRVTWASVPYAQRDGVERYLADTWHPLVGDAFPNAYPIAVNSPW